MNVIDNAWKIPLSTGGIYRIVINEDSLELYRIFSGKYIQNKLQLRKDIDYIDSLIVPGATDPVEPADLYSKIKHTVEIITDNYEKDLAEKTKTINENKDPDDYEKLRFSDITRIKFQEGKEKFPELTLNNQKFILPSRNFIELNSSDKKKYAEYNSFVQEIKNKIDLK
ncbi:hypothetical protein [Ferroplasma sp.]|uniref:hypothetical protein n=1 Tax=Ferroplasma sp. TaxID=2591003 RepID=UPI00307F66CE